MVAKVPQKFPARHLVVLAVQMTGETEDAQIGPHGKSATVTGTGTGTKTGTETETETVDGTAIVPGRGIAGEKDAAALVKGAIRAEILGEAGLETGEDKRFTMAVDWPEERG